jgi:hypothetical protein
MGGIQMKYYSYFDGPDGVATTISELQILEQYFEYWSKRMQEVGKDSEISPQNCIDDFCVIHWAWEVFP